jgi:DNA (cytosine-5)-methyltransferase 1
MTAARKLMVCDLFCGAGGTSTGVAQACRELDLVVELLAINHWETAIATHAKNHPWARHLCANVDAIDPRKVVAGGHLDLLVASPECIWHSTARGGKPINDQARASAWRILEWCERLHVSNVLIENVPEFRGWGPLGTDDRPLKSKRGHIFHAFIEGLRAMNYNIEYRVLNAADYGAATSRRRLFIVAKRGRRKIRWPQATHAKGGHIDMFGTLKPHRAAREIIDWSIPGSSIFTRKKSLARTTLLRIEAGLLRYGGPLAPLFVSALRAYMNGKQYGDPVEIDPTSPAGEAFLAILRGTGDRQVQSSTQPCSDPVPALTAGGGHVALVEPKAFITVLNNNNVPKSTDQPLPTVTGGNRLFLTEAEAFILQQQSGGAPRGVSEPLPTIAGKGAQSLVEPEAFILPQNGSNKPRSVNDPAPVITTTSRGIGIVDPKAFIVPFYSERPGQNGRTHDVDAPLPTPPCSPKFAIVDPIVVTPGGPNLPEGRPVSEPLPTVTCKARMALATPLIVQTDQLGSSGKCVRSVDEPVPTLHTKANLMVVNPIVVGAGGPQGAGEPRSVEEPLGTVLAENHKMLIQPVIVQTNHSGGHSGRIHSVEDPLTGVTASRGHAIAVPVITKYYSNGDGKDGQSIEEPLGTVTTKQRFALAEPVVTRLGIDIRFRMFRTHELARAMGFEHYTFTGTIEEQTRQIGNAVEVNIAKALVKAILEG